MKNKIQKLLKQKESLTLEFKESKSKLNKDIYDTVCAFSNREGGYIFLGVSDDGKIIGVDMDKIEQLKSDFITSINNPQKLNPPIYAYINDTSIDSKIILYIYVPKSSSVHRLNGKIYDRNGDSDIDITNQTSQVASLYMQKQNYFSENKIYPYATLDDFDLSLLEKVRIRAKNENGGSHIWEEMDDMELLRSTGCYKKDIETNKEGFTLASILLFGKDKTIMNVLPYHRIDAILRKVNIDRYDDRDDIRTNLIDSYDRLMDFVKKHLNDPFYLEGEQRVSIRNKIFREAVVNMLMHREYSNAFISKLIIQKERVVFENANKPKEFKQLTPQNFTPYPKNPTIAKVFREIGYAEELGSGVRNMFKYSKIYGGSNPRLEEENVFTATILLRESDATPQATPQAILDFCKEAKSANEIMEFLNLKDKKHFRTAILKPLLQKGLIRETIPEKPTTPKQKYQRTV